MKEHVSGRTVAVVGRAACLLGSGCGAAIDACDVVVRVNWSFPIAADPRDVGARSDILYHALCVDPGAALAAGIRCVPVDHSLRRAIARGSRLGAKRYRPTTGLVAIFHALAAGARCVRAFGFDLYASGYSGPTPALAPHKKWTWRHNIREDRHILRRLLRVDPRFEPDGVLRGAICA